MLRISECNTTNEATTLKLEGRIVGRLISEVQNACETVFARGCKLVLDLSDVSFIDRQGLVLFQDLLRHEVTFVNCSPFLLEQLKIVGSPCNKAAAIQMENPF
jgi:anti-anti-sigma regulatory factor